MTAEASGPVGYRPGTLVIGWPGRVAARVIEALLNRGEVVLALVPAGTRTAPASGATCFEAELSSIDFGLDGATYLELARSAERIVHAVEPTPSSGRLDRSPLVRAAGELSELARAGAGTRGVTMVSSLFVFGDAQGPVRESELGVGQTFLSPLEEALALAERVVRAGLGGVPLSVVRAAPLSGDALGRELFPTSPLARLAEKVRLAGAPLELDFRGQPVRFETVDRLVEVVLRTWQQPAARTLHLVDAEPLTDRQLVTWLAERLGRTLLPPPPGMHFRTHLKLSDVPLARSILGYPTRFDRAEAEHFCADLLDSDPRAVLSTFFPAQEVLGTPDLESEPTSEGNVEV